MKSKKLVSLLLAALMTVSVGIQPAFAAGNDAGDPWDSDAQWPQLTRAASEMKPETRSLPTKSGQAPPILD